MKADGVTWPSLAQRNRSAQKHRIPWYWKFFPKGNDSLTQAVLTVTLNF